MKPAANICSSHIGHPHVLAAFRHRKEAPPVVALEVAFHDESLAGMATAHEGEAGFTLGLAV